MEKIYMQEEQQQSQKQKLSKMSRFSIGLSFFVAVFAVVSLIAAGFNNLSYAAPTVTGNFTFRHALGAGTQDVFVVASSLEEGAGTYNVPLYLANGTDYLDENSVPIFCIEAANDNISVGATYELEKSLDDIGLLYILNKSRLLNTNSTGIIPTSASITFEGDTSTDHVDGYKMVEAYATQVAIWVYMYENYYQLNNTTYAMHSLASGSKTADQNMQAIETANILTSNQLGITANFGSGKYIYNTYIKDVVKAAERYTGVKTLTLTKADNTISKVGDDGWYQSSKITVSADPANDLQSFEVTVSGVEGAVVMYEKEAGVYEEKTSFNFKNDDKQRSFVVRVPTNKVSQEASKVTVTVRGLFDNYLSGSVYKSGNNQKVVTVTGTQNYESSQLLIDFMGVPNTGMSKAQTIYFIGLIVLLCGVGIIYANAKPVQIEE